MCRWLNSLLLFCCCPSFTSPSQVFIIHPSAWFYDSMLLVLQRTVLWIQANTTSQVLPATGGLQGWRGCCCIAVMSHFCNLPHSIGKYMEASEMPFPRPQEVCQKQSLEQNTTCLNPFWRVWDRSYQIPSKWSETVTVDLCLQSGTVWQWTINPEISSMPFSDLTHLKVVSAP